jgi:cytoskeletal protein CcmA (bactofilin family)
MWKQDQAVATPPSTPPPNPVAANMPSAVAAVALSDVGQSVGQSVSIKGELSGSEDMVLHGKMEGRISLPNHMLTVGTQAAVKADIAARAVVVKGIVTGNVTAAEKLEIQSNGTVLGDVISPRLVIADGGSLQGKVEMKPKA